MYKPTDIMKTILTLALVLFFGVTAMGQSSTENRKVAVVKHGVILLQLPTATAKSPSNHDLSMVFRFRNSLIKKSLTFRTERQRYRYV